MNEQQTPPLDPYMSPEQNPYYRPYVKPTRIPYVFTPCDAAYACFAFALGFLSWHFELFSNLGAFIVLIAALIGTAMYLHARGFKVTGRSAAVFIVCVIGTLPLLLFDSVPLFILLVFFVLFACFYWVAVITGNSVEERVSGYVLADWLNQTFVVPFANFLGVFIAIKTAAKDTKRGKTVLIGLAGLCIAIPLIVGVTLLLINSDAGFEKFANDFSEWIGLNDIGTYIAKFIGGIPIAMYIFGSLSGNMQKRYSNKITKEGTAKGLAAAHRIPRAAILTPLTVLCVLYIVYIVVMSIYLFSGLTGRLPDEWFIYSEYARRGFFELCGVAAINLFVMAFTYSFAKREAGEHPKAMRILTCLLSIMTVLLIATAVSKMLLYIDAYGLSRLRIYTLWFLILLFVVFVILIIWHIRPFNAGRPIVISSVALLLVLFLANTDGLIAKYNVWQYENGKIRTSAVDTDMLAGMSDAVLPHLASLRDNAENFSVSLAARVAISKIEARHKFGTGMFSEPRDSFRNWSIQSALTEKYLPTKPLISENDDVILIRDEPYSTSLTELDLSGMYLTDEDIVPLQHMTNLTILYLFNNNISDLSPLSGLTDLTTLDLRYNHIYDLAPLSGLSSLTRLSLENNNIEYLSPLASLTNLTSLDLSRNTIYDISPLSGLANLKELNLDRNHIYDLAPLSSLTNLRWLSLASNKIDDISPLTTLVNLRDLSLSRNKITDLTPLESLGNLIWLDIDNNDIEDLRPLSAISNLTYTNLENNRISDWAPARGIRNIQGSP